MSGFALFMHGAGWVAFTLVSAIFSAGIYLVNQYMRQPGHALVFWSRLFTVLALTPCAAFVRMPQSPLFYAAVVATAFCAAFGDIRTFNVAARYGGGVVSRTQPLVIFMTFLLWFAFNPALFGQYARHPLHTGLVLLALGGCGFFSSRLRKCAISRRAFLEMLPALFAYTAATVLNKYAMGHGPLAGAVFGYMYMQSATVVILTGGYILLKGKRPRAETGERRPRKMARAAAMLVFGWIGAMIFKSTAMAFVPNPAYLSALLYTAPVFIAIFYKLTGHKEEADIMSGLGLVACAALLAAATV